MENFLPLDSQMSPTAKGKDSTSDVMVSGERMLTLDYRKNKKETPQKEDEKGIVRIPLLPSHAGQPWVIVRMNLQYERSVLKVLAKTYPLLYARPLLGYFFIQGNPAAFDEYCRQRGLQAHCLYHKVSETVEQSAQPMAQPPSQPSTLFRAETISDQQAHQLIAVLNDDPSRFALMVHDLAYYADGHQFVVCVDGPLRGFQGYIVRVHRDRRFVFQMANGITCSYTNLRDSRFITYEDFQSQQLDSPTS